MESIFSPFKAWASYGDEVLSPPARFWPPLVKNLSAEPLPDFSGYRIRAQLADPPHDWVYLIPQRNCPMSRRVAEEQICFMEARGEIRAQRGGRGEAVPRFGWGTEPAPPPEIKEGRGG